MWRYKLVPMDMPGRRQAAINSCEAKLNELGGKGWEIVAVIASGDSWLTLLKMPHEIGTF